MSNSYEDQRMQKRVEVSNTFSKGNWINSDKANRYVRTVVSGDPLCLPTSLGNWRDSMHICN